jgi:AcrR family transcriptional regulator
VQAVADELGVTRAAIYHYVDDVEELRRIAAYARMSDFAGLADEDRSWQAWLRDYARATRAWRIAHGDPYVQLSLTTPETHWFLVIVDRAIDILVNAGFPERRARFAFQFLVGVVWINVQDELNWRQSPKERPPVRNLPKDLGGLHDLPHIRAALKEPTWWGNWDDRFERELDWVILALETELGSLK